MNSFLLLDGEDMNFLWDTIQEQRIIFHPVIAPDGRLDYEKFFESKAKNDAIAVIRGEVRIVVEFTTIIFVPGMSK